MLVLWVKNAIEMRGASAVSNGTMSVLSEGDINIHESRQQERLSEATKWTKHGVFQSKGETRHHNHNYDIAEGSTLDADKIYIHSNNGNVDIQGSNAVAENGLVIKANNIDIHEAENRVYSDDITAKKDLERSVVVLVLPLVLKNKPQKVIRLSFMRKVAK